MKNQATQLRQAMDPSNELFCLRPSLFPMKSIVWLKCESKGKDYSFDAVKRHRWKSLTTFHLMTLNKFTVEWVRALWNCSFCVMRGFDIS